MVTIPWIWFGMTTDSSISTFEKWIGISFQHLFTTFPYPFTLISPFTTLPRIQALPWVHIVTKYAPSWL
jgi:hypothetical protein